MQGGEVVLDLSTVVDQVKQLLVDRGLTFVQNAPPIPAADQQIVLLESHQLKQVRTIYAFTNPVAKWLLPVVALLYLGGLLLSRRRPRTTVVIGVLLAANALLVALVLSIGRQLFINQLSGTVFGPASTVFYDTLLSYLERGQRVMLWLGLILVLIGLVRRWHEAGHRRTHHDRRRLGVHRRLPRGHPGGRRGALDRRERPLAADRGRGARRGRPGVGQRHLRSHGCSGRPSSWSSSWRSSRSWSGRAGPPVRSARVATTRTGRPRSRRTPIPLPAGGKA